MNRSFRLTRYDFERTTHQYGDSIWKTSIVLMTPQRTVPSGWFSRIHDFNLHRACTTPTAS